MSFCTEGCVQSAWLSGTAAGSAFVFRIRNPNPPGSQRLSVVLLLLLFNMYVFVGPVCCVWPGARAGWVMRSPGLESPGLREVLCSSAMFGSAGSSVCGSWSSPRRALGPKRLRASRQVWSAAGADVLRVLLGFSAAPQELLQQLSENGGVKFQLWDAEKDSDRNIPACWSSIQQNNTFYKQERHFTCLMQSNSLIFDIVWFIYLHLLHYSEEN